MLVDVKDYHDKDRVRIAALMHKYTIVGSQCIPLYADVDAPTLYDDELHSNYFTTLSDETQNTYVADYISINTSGEILGLFHVHYTKNENMGGLSASSIYTHRFVSENSITFARDMRKFYNQVMESAGVVSLVVILNTVFSNGLIGPGDTPIYPKYHGSIAYGGITGGLRNVLQYYNGRSQDASPSLCADGITRPTQVWRFITKIGRSLELSY